MLFALTLLTISLSPPPAFPVETAEELYHHLQRSGAKTKAEMLAALPSEFRQNFVLVRESRSRQRGTPELPRVLHFNKSGSLVVTSSGHGPDADPAAEALEVMDLDPATGRWRFAALSFEGGTLAPPAYNLRSCLACHGSNPRPLWGEYPNWISAYGGNPENGVDKMKGPELEQFRSFARGASTHEGYRHLDLRLWDQGFYLPNSTYGLPNSVFTARMGLRHAQALHEQLRHARAPRALRAWFVATSRACEPNPGLLERVHATYEARLQSDLAFRQRWEGEPASLAHTKVIRLLGLSPEADFRLDQLPRHFGPNQEEAMIPHWNAGGDSISDLLAFLTLRELQAEDPSLRALLSGQEAASARIHRLAFSLSSAELAALDQESSRADYLASLFPYALKQALPATGSEARAAVCRHLATAQP